jgi:hypothetical protein
VGFDSNSEYIPSSILQVRGYPENKIYFEAEPILWMNGQTHDQSGDQVWWFDFSGLTREGSYYIYDPAQNLSSNLFVISVTIYNNVLIQAVRSFYYQRCGTAIDTPFAHANWTHRACHIGFSQDLDCRLVTDWSSETSRNLSGGWHDAGDYNKYVNYAYSTLHDLLFAYEENSKVWNDSYGLPESGNGIPDLLDEIKWELEWLLKMQITDGSVLHKVSAINWDDAESPPSSENTRRCYAPPTASATISSCGVFAHAAIVYRTLGIEALSVFADTLEEAAIRAWSWLEGNPDLIPSEYDNIGFENATAELTEYTQRALLMVDASYLFVLTSEDEFKQYFDNHFQESHLFKWGAVHYTYDDPVILDGMLYYSKSPNATSWIVNEIQEKYQEAMMVSWNDIAPIFDSREEIDAYRAYLDDYSWGSNQHKGSIGTFITNIAQYQMPCCSPDEIAASASAFVHYIHGVNPLSVVYLSNMNEFGAENSVPELYHMWFADGSKWDNVMSSEYGPAPGILVGGPNEFYESPGEQVIEPPENQPAQKSYKSWNSSSDHSWEITENQIIYQAAYIRLLSKFVSGDFFNNILQEKHKEENIFTVKIWPNPFDSSTTITFELEEKTNTEIYIFDITGQLISYNDLGYLGIDNHQIEWHSESLSTGVYFCKIVAGNKTWVGKMYINH